MRSTNGAARPWSAAEWHGHPAQPVRASHVDLTKVAYLGSRVAEWLGRRAFAAELLPDELTRLSRWSGGRC